MAGVSNSGTCAEPEIEVSGFPAVEPAVSGGLAGPRMPASIVPVSQAVVPSKWYRLRRNGAALVNYLLDSEVHTYAFSVAANAILSFIPFIVLLYTIALSLFHSPAMADVVSDMIHYFFPSNQDWIAKNLVLEAPRHGVQVFSLVMILISCTGIFLPLEVALNQAWGVARSRNYLMNQLVAFGLAILMVALGMISIALSAAQRTILSFIFFHHTDNFVFNGISYLWLALCTGVAVHSFLLRDLLAAAQSQGARETGAARRRSSPGSSGSLPNTRSSQYSRTSTSSRSTGRSIFRWDCSSGPTSPASSCSPARSTASRGSTGSQSSLRFFHHEAYGSLNALIAIAFGPRPAGSIVNSDCDLVRTTATSADRASTTNSKCPADENAIAKGPSPTWMEPARLPSSIE